MPRRWRRPMPPHPTAAYLTLSGTTSTPDRFFAPGRFYRHRYLANMRAGRSAAVGALLGVAVGAIALGLALRDVDAAALAAAFARAGIAPIVLGAAMHVGVQLVYALRWRLLLRQPGLSLARTFGVVGLGYLANYTLPGRPGELVRAGLMRGLAGVPLALGLGSLLLEKVLDGVTILGSALLYSLIGELPPLVRASAAVGAGTFALAGALLALVALVPAGRLPLPGWARERLDEVAVPLRGLARPRALAALGLLGALIWAGIVLPQGLR